MRVPEEATVSRKDRSPAGPEKLRPTPIVLAKSAVTIATALSKSPAFRAAIHELSIDSGSSPCAVIFAIGSSVGEDAPIKAGQPPKAVMRITVLPLK